MAGVISIIKTITAIITAAIFQVGMLGAVDETPADAAKEFMAGITDVQSQIASMYMGNQYVNFLANVEGPEKARKNLQEDLTKNLTYEIAAIEERDDLAVARVDIKTNDFSDVLENYEEESYKYITENLYSDEVVDKKALKDKCFEIYAEEIAHEAEEGKLHEDTVYLPMKKDGHGVWNVMLSDEIMKKILGNIALPEDVLEKTPGEKKEEEKEI